MFLYLRAGLAGVLGFCVAASVWAQAGGLKLDGVMNTVRPLDGTRWIGWSNGQPSALYLLKEGAEPLALGTMPGMPVAMAEGRDRVLWLGENFSAVAPLDNLAAIEITPGVEGWTLAVGSAVGFVKTNTEKLAFSSDGQNWRAVETDIISESTRVSGLATDGEKFVALLELSRGDEANNIHSIIAVSSDGLKWDGAYFSEPQPGEPELTTLVHGNGRWMAYGVGSVYSSANGREWTSVPARRGAMPQLREAFIDTGGGEWWAVDWRDRYQFSSDGLDWSEEPQYLHQFSKGSGSLWVVGAQGMRNLALDAEGKLRVATLAAIKAVATLPPAAMVVANPAAPTKPVASAPAAKVARLSNEELAKRWASLDELLQAETTMVGFSRRLSELAILFSQAENEKVSLAVQTSALVFVLKYGDAACLDAFEPALNEKEYADAQLMLKNGLELKSALRAQGQDVPPVARGERGMQVVGQLWDTHQMRLNFLSGTHGSAYDIAVAHNNGQSFKKDADISLLWSIITLNLIPELKSLDFEGAPGVEIFLAAGSGVAAANSVGEVNLNRGELGFMPRQWELIEQATIAGLLAAKKLLDARATWRVDAAHMPEPMWPPTAFAKWDKSKEPNLRPLFDRHVAFSREVMAYRAGLTPGDAPDRDRWLALLARHEALLQDPEIRALRDGYVQGSVGIALLYTADTPISPSWLIHMQQAKAGLAAVAIDPDLWNFRARMLLWSGQLAEARRDVVMAELMLELEAIKTDIFHHLLVNTTRLLALELSLPEAVIRAERDGVAPYNRLALNRAALLGSKLDPTQEDLAANLYANFGQRLREAWKLPDAEERARVETALFTLYRDDLKGLPLANRHFEPLREITDLSWGSRERDPERAMRDVETVIYVGAHPFFLMRRAELLGLSGGREREEDALRAILSIWPNYTPVKNRLAMLQAGEQRKVQAQAAAVAKAKAETAQADYAAALALLTKGERAAGRAALERAAAGEAPALSTLLLLAELQSNPQEAAKAEATLLRAVASYPTEPRAAARLGLLLVGQQKLNEASSVLRPVIRLDSDAPETQAVKVLVDTLSVVKQVPSAGPMAIEQAVKQLEAMKAKRYAMEVHVILAQFKMMQRDQAGAINELALMADGMDYAPPELLFQIGQTMRNLGKPEVGKGYIERAAALGLPQAKELMKQL